LKTKLLLLLIFFIFIKIIFIYNLKNQENNLTLLKKEFFTNLNEHQVLLLRAIYNFNTSIFAVKQWINSHKLEELASDKNKFYNFYSQVILLDPFFASSVIYSATYIESILEDPKLALKIIKLAKKYSSENIHKYNYLEFLILIKLINQEKNLTQENYNKLLDLATKLTQKDKKFSQNWLYDMIIYLKDNKNLQQEKLKSLQWLYQNSVSKAEKNRIKNNI
jgi:hypothetical protein